jgi:uncharacterized protein YndB with AHSA1/START domain
MTEFLDTDSGQIAYEVTGLTVAAEEVVAARPELVWDLVADITRVGRWSPECIRAAWLGEPGRPQPGARFTGHNRFPNGFEYEVTCVVTEADRPRAFAWVVLDDSGDPARPSSSWRYRIDPLPGGGSRVRQRFTHGPGASYLRAAAAEAPDRAAEIIAARRQGLRANMSATLRAMKAAAESSHARAATLYPNVTKGAWDDWVPGYPQWADRLRGASPPAAHSPSVICPAFAPKEHESWTQTPGAFRAATCGYLTPTATGRCLS